MNLIQILNLLTGKDVSHKKEYPKTIQSQNFNVPTKKEKPQITFPENYCPQTKFLSACKDIPVQTDYEAYFKNGILYNVNPRNRSIPLYEDRQTAYNARYIISDNIRYDLENAEYIKNMHIPNFPYNRGISTPTMNLDYILKMRLGVENRPILAIPLAYKVANLMMASGIGWTKKDYYRVVIQLWSIGEVNYADGLLEQLKKYVPAINQKDEAKYYYNNSFDEALRYAKEIKSDYIQIGHSGSVCSQCAPFQNRIYSISGNDKRFPKLPEFIKKNHGLHCNISIYSILYYNGFTITQYIYKPNGEVMSKEVDSIKYSNRPFVDDRSDFEKQNCENWKLKNDKRKEAEDNYFNRQSWIDKYNEHLEYQQIVDILGDKAPKSYSGYKRMKKSNSPNYQKILKLLERL